MNMKDKESACAEKVYKITTEDLPLSCPMKNMPLWNAHPKVYLSIEKTGTAKCGYCGAEFVLTDFSTKLTDAEKTDVEYAEHI